MSKDVNLIKEIEEYLSSGECSLEEDARYVFLTLERIKELLNRVAAASGHPPFDEWVGMPPEARGEIHTIPKVT